MNLLSASVPVLASLHLDETTAFNQQRLGFEPRLRTDDYLIVERDGCEIHFWSCTDCPIAENTSCYLRGDTLGLHDDFARWGLALAPLLKRAWRMRELYVIDRHGNPLKIGEPV